MKTQSKPRAPKPEEFRFDPEGHKYFVGDKRVPAVSDILQKVGLTRDYKGVDPFYRDRGIATHKAIELYLQGNLDATSLDPAIKPQFEAFLGYWDKHMDEKILALEKPMHTGLEFAGTPDLITEAAVYDWKCSKDHDKVADLQGQAYKSMTMGGGLDLSTYPPFIVVELHDDGSFKEFDYGTGFSEWPAVMKLYDWKTR